LEDAPSRTALGTAFARAWHRRVDDPPTVLDDPVAERLLPAYQQRYLRRLGALARFWRGYYLRQAEAEFEYDGVKGVGIAEMGVNLKNYDIDLDFTY